MLVVQRRITQSMQIILGVALLTACATPGAAEMSSTAEPSDNQPARETLRIGSFGQTLTQLAAEAEGFLAEQGLTVEYQQVRSSTEQFKGLQDGTYDLALTATDNVLNYRYNDSNELGAALDVQIVAGMSYGQNLALTVRPEIASIGDLRGKKLGVDAPDSGYAYILYHMLRAHGLERNVDYEVVSVGGPAQRLEALRTGDVSGGLLSGGFEISAVDAGFPLLLTVQDITSPYLGGVAAAREGWLRDNHDVVVRLLRAYHAAAQWAVDPANRDAAIDLLMTQSDIDRPRAEKLYDTQLAPGVGIIRDLTIDPEGLLANLELRHEFNGFDQQHDIRYLASPPSGLYDATYLERAIKYGR